MAEDYETDISVRPYFLRFSLHGDASQHYNLLISHNAGWNDIMEAFDERYAPEEKQDEISVRFVALSIEDFKEAGDQEYQSSLDTLIEKINHLARMARAKDRNE